MLTLLDSSHRVLALPAQSLRYHALVSRARAWAAMTEAERLHAWLTHGERIVDAEAPTARFDRPPEIDA